MIYRSESFDVDTASGELRRNGLVIPLDPQVYHLLILLLKNRDRLVTKDEIIDQVWHGRAIADSTLITRIKQVRAAIGDTGKAQKYLKTYSKRGFRFVGLLTEIGDTSRGSNGQVEDPDAAVAGTGETHLHSAPSIAILPFRSHGTPDALEGVNLGDALAHDLIVELARSNWLLVIARGSTFRFRGENVNLSEAGHALGAKYCVTGEVTSSQGRLGIFVELVRASDCSVVWANDYELRFDQIHRVRSEVCAQLFSAIERKVLTAEVQEAKLKSPDNLDVWSFYHLGMDRLLSHSEPDVVVASQHFSKAIERDPQFARARAGLSSAFYMRAQVERQQGTDTFIKLAKIEAEKAVELDPLDPFANFSLSGIAYMAGDIDGAITWTDLAIAINPNYAHAVSCRGWLSVACGDGQAGQEYADLAMKLSPLDPLYFGMQIVRVMSHIVRGEYADAVLWADKAAGSAQVSPFVDLVTVISHELNGDHTEARRRASRIKAATPGVNQDVFFGVFPFRSQTHKATIAGALSEHGL